MAGQLLYTTQKPELLGEKSMMGFPGLDLHIGLMFFYTPYNKAYKLLDLFASQFRNDYPKFEAWMMPMCNATPQQATECFNVLRTWCNDNLHNRN